MSMFCMSAMLFFFSFKVQYFYVLFSWMFYVEKYYDASDAVLFQYVPYICMFPHGAIYNPLSMYVK